MTEKPHKRRITLNIYATDHEYIMKYLEETDFTATELVRKIIHDWCN